MIWKSFPPRTSLPALVLLLAAVVPAWAGQAEQPRDWALTLYTGVHTTRTIGQASFNIPGRFTDHYLHGLALSRRMGEFWDHFSWETEGMAAWHRDRRPETRQDYLELTAAVLIRFEHFPWNHLLRTTIAGGDGLSYATEGPIIEEELKNGQRRRLLNYLTFELTLDLPWVEGLELSYRIHHRSGVFGLFGGARGASDFYLWGLRYRF